MSSRDKHIEQLWAYVEGELSPHDAQDIEQAIAKDKALSDQCEQMRALRRMVRHLPRQKAPADFVARVVAQAERATLVDAMPHQHYKPPLVWMRYVATAAVVMLCVGIGAAIVVSLASIPQVNMGQARRGSSEPQLAQATADRKSETPAVSHDAKVLLADGAPSQPIGGTGGGLVYNHPSAGVAKSSPESSAGLMLAKKGLDVSDVASAVRGVESAAAVNIDFYTQAQILPDALESVKNVLISNGIEPADQPVTTASNQVSLGLPQWGNNFEVTRTSGDQIQILAYVPAEQISQLRTQIDTAVQNQAMQAAEDLAVKDNGSNQSGRMGGAAAYSSPADKPMSLAQAPAAVDVRGRRRDVAAQEISSRLGAASSQDEFKSRGAVVAEASARPKIAATPMPEAAAMPSPAVYPAPAPQSQPILAAKAMRVDGVVWGNGIGTNQIAASASPARQQVRNQQYLYQNQAQNQTQNSNQTMIQSRLVINLNSTSQFQRIAPASNATSAPSGTAQPQ